MHCNFMFLLSKISSYRFFNTWKLTRCNLFFRLLFKILSGKHGSYYHFLKESNLYFNELSQLLRRCFLHIWLTASFPCLQWPCRASRPSAAPLHKEPVRPPRAPRESAAATSSPQSLSSSAWILPTAKYQLRHLAPVLALWRTVMAPGTTWSPHVSSKCQYRGSCRASKWRMRTCVRGISRISITHTSPTSCFPLRAPFIITGLRPRTHLSHPASILLRDTSGRTPALCTVSVKTIWPRRTGKTRYPDSHCFLLNTRNTEVRPCRHVRWNLTDLFMCPWTWTQLVRTSSWTAPGFWVPPVWESSLVLDFLTHSSSPTATTSWTTRRLLLTAEDRWARRGCAQCAGITRPASTMECAPARVARVSSRFVLAAPLVYTCVKSYGFTF